MSGFKFDVLVNGCELKTLLDTGNNSCGIIGEKLCKTLEIEIDRTERKTAQTYGGKVPIIGTAIVPMEVPRYGRVDLKCNVITDVTSDINLGEDFTKKYVTSINMRKGFLHLDNQLKPVVSRYFRILQEKEEIGDKSSESEIKVAEIKEIELYDSEMLKLRKKNEEEEEEVNIYGLNDKDKPHLEGKDKEISDKLKEKYREKYERLTSSDIKQVKTKKRIKLEKESGKSLDDVHFPKGKGGIRQIKSS